MFFFPTPNFNFIERENIKNIESMERSENFVDLFDYHVSSCRKDSFKNLGTYKILSNYDN